MSQPEPEMQSTGNPNASQWALRDLRRIPRGSPCFSYPADVSLARPPRKPVGVHCFNYSAEVPLGIRNRSAAQRVRHGLPAMPAHTCFSY